MAYTLTHDVFACECHETCGWCVEPHLYKSLREYAPEGVALCKECYKEATGK